MPKLKDVKEKEKPKDCHFCSMEAKTKFEYDLRRYTDKSYKQYVLVCRPHFDELCDMTYTNKVNTYLPVGQREYVAVKHLESKLNVKNTIQFKQ